MTHDHYGRTTQDTNGSLTHRVSPTGAPQSDGVLNESVRLKIRHYRQIYEDSPDPIVFLSITVNTSGHVYEDFERPFRIFWGISSSFVFHYILSPLLLCVLLPLENLLWAKLRDYAISRVNPNPRKVFLVRVVKM
jgi:hypothetical protein